jgi:hypothetical protein
MNWLSITAGLAAFSLLLATVPSARAQNDFGIPALPDGQGPVHLPTDKYPVRPSSSPAFTIPLGPLGFSPPGKNYLLRKQSLVSLDFIDEDRLLFTFHAPSGLLQRNAAHDTELDQQRIDAMVLTLPGGRIESRATWIVPDRSRYLWMLNNGDFLLRVSDGVDVGDVQLKTKPYLRVPGRLLWIQMDPQQQILITNSLEPEAGGPESSASSALAEGSSVVILNQQKSIAQNILVARTTNRLSGELLRVSRVAWTHQTTDWPVNSEGYLERVKDDDKRWTLKMNAFNGPDRPLSTVVSTCPPRYSFLSDTVLLLSTCDPEEGWKLQAMSTFGDPLWRQRAGMNAIFPLLVVASNGSRAARETLLLKRSVDHYKRLLRADDFQGQMVTVFNTDTGRKVFEAPLTPIFDGGGNLAVSPSGRRVAILNAGMIQVFELPAPPPPPAIRKRLPKPTAAAASASAPPAP